MLKAGAYNATIQFCYGTGGDCAALMQSHTPQPFRFVPSGSPGACLEACPTCNADSTFTGAKHVVLREKCEPGPLNAWRAMDNATWFGPTQTGWVLQNDATGL